MSEPPSFSRRCVSAFAVALLLLGLVYARSADAQQADMSLKGGHVIDPRNGIDQPMEAPPILSLRLSPHT